MEKQVGRPKLLPSALKLTKRQRAFSDHYLETGNGSQSALATYDCNRRTARQIAYENLHNAKVITYLREKLLTRDLMDESLQTLRDALKADKPVAVDGGIEAWPDTANRLKAVTLITKLTLALTSFNQNQNNGNISAEDYSRQYLREKFILENKREPTETELADLVVIDLEKNDAEIWAFRSEKGVVAASLMPRDHIDD